jgi:hypothetical protein
MQTAEFKLKNEKKGAGWRERRRAIKSRESARREGGKTSMQSAKCKLKSER